MKDSSAYLPGLQEQMDSDAILRDRARRSGLVGASGGPALPTLGGLVPADVYTSEHGEVIPYDPLLPKILEPAIFFPEARPLDGMALPLASMARWLMGRLRDRRGMGQRVRRLIMHSDSYMDLLGVSRRFVPVATVDAMVFEGLPVSIDKSYSFREVGFNG